MAEARGKRSFCFLRKSRQPSKLACLLFLGGSERIRTSERLSPLHAFQACALNHSATLPPKLIIPYFSGIFRNRHEQRNLTHLKKSHMDAQSAPRTRWKVTLISLRESYAPARPAREPINVRKMYVILTLEPINVRKKSCQPKKLMVECGYKGLHPWITYGGRW